MSARNLIEGVTDACVGQAADDALAIVSANGR